MLMIFAGALWVFLFTLESLVDIHGRFGFHVCRIFRGELCFGESNGRTVARLVPVHSCTNLDSFHSDLRYHIRYRLKEVSGEQLPGLDVTHLHRLVASDVEQPRSMDALRFCGACGVLALLVRV